MKSSLFLVIRKQIVSFRIVGLMLAIAPLWLMLVAVNRSAYAQAVDDANSSATNSASSPADWTQFLRDNMQRWTPYETVLNNITVRSLDLKWKTTIGRGDAASAPAVVNGVVYFGGAADGNVYALSASTGAKLWNYTTGGQLESSPAVANGVVYIGSTNHNVYALSASTGAKMWNYTTGGEAGSSPAVVNGVVYIGSDDYNVYALNASTGALIWKYATGYFVDSSPAVVNGVVYVASEDQNLYALNASTGAKLWSYNAMSGALSPAVMANGIVYIHSIDNLYALNSSTGALLWNFNSPGGGGVGSTPAVANGVVYFQAGGFFALNASTGAMLWTSAVRPSSAFYSAPAVANGVVYIGGTGSPRDPGSIFALDARTGVPLWAYSILGGPSPLTIVNGVVYVRGADVNTGIVNAYAFTLGNADLFLRISPSTTTVNEGDLLTYAFPVWNLGPVAASQEVLNTRVPAGTTFDYIRISGTPGLGTCTHPPYH